MRWWEQQRAETVHGGARVLLTDLHTGIDIHYERDSRYRFLVSFTAHHKAKTITRVAQITRRTSAANVSRQKGYRMSLDKTKEEVGRYVTLYITETAKRLERVLA